MSNIRTHRGRERCSTVPYDDHHVSEVTSVNENDNNREHVISDIICRSNSHPVIPENIEA